jgi:hypothetical protein
MQTHVHKGNMARELEQQYVGEHRLAQLVHNDIVTIQALDNPKNIVDIHICAL